MRTSPAQGLDRLPILVTTAACLALIALKLLFTWHININWDEFNFLSYVHESQRGELKLFLQGGYTHLFGWLPETGGDEADQIIKARLAMFALLVVSIVLMWRIARLWVGSVAAMVAVLCYLSMSPVLRHAASFRYDSLMLPLILLAIYWMASPRRNTIRIVATGICLGVAGFISIKAVLFAPLIAALLALDSLKNDSQALRTWARATTLLGVCALATLATLLYLHGLTLVPDATAAQGTALEAARKTLIDPPIFPRKAIFLATLNVDTFAWLLMLAGFFCGLANRRRWPACACALAIAPALFYRNAWPYYYVLMLAPATLLAGVAVEVVTGALRGSGRPVAAAVLAIGIALLLFFTGSGYLLGLQAPDQKAQRTLIAAVHHVFPQPVAYFDHSGMISSYPRAGFLMSTWGIEKYRASGQGFVAPALKKLRPPLLIANRAIIDPESATFRLLLDEDRKLIRESYVQYWGPIWVAGTQFELSGAAPQLLRLPFPERYRLESREPILANGVPLSPGAEIQVSAPIWIARAPSKVQSKPLAGRLIIASAQPPPSAPPIRVSSIYADL